LRAVVLLGFWEDPLSEGYWKGVVETSFKRSSKSATVRPGILCLTTQPPSHTVTLCIAANGHRCHKRDISILTTQLDFHFKNAWNTFIQSTRYYLPIFVRIEQEGSEIFASGRLSGLGRLSGQAQYWPLSRCRVSVVAVAGIIVVYC
jgi:hypothetical protein